MRLLAALMICLAAGPALAQVLDGPLYADLNGDGMAEAFTLEQIEVPYVQLVVRNTGGAPVIVPDIAWAGGMSSPPYLSLTEFGSVQVISQNDAVGRGRWELILTLAHRQGALRVAGFTYSWRDTLDPDDFGSCDVNLLTGRGETSRSGEKPFAITVRGGAPAVTDWQSETFELPDACRH